VTIDLWWPFHDLWHHLVTLDLWWPFHNLPWPLASFGDPWPLVITESLEWTLYERLIVGQHGSEIVLCFNHPNVSKSIKWCGYERTDVLCV
jgi:hypothetical protein